LTEYVIPFPAFEFINHMVIQAEDENDAIVKAQAELDSWRWKVGREHGRLAIRLFKDPSE
jgi:hypothetical protein